MSCLSINIWVVKLNGEVKIWLPVCVVNNWNLDLEILLLLLESHYVINWGVVHVSLGCSVNGSNSNGNLLVGRFLTFLNSQENVSTAFSNRVPKAFKSNQLVFINNFVL